MRKVIGLNVAVVVIGLVFTSGTAFAGNAAPSGPHFNINIIGHPKGGISGDYSRGHSIMIPLRNVQSRAELVCNVDRVQLVDDIAPTWETSEPTGAKIYFVAGDHFEIIDRDGTDSDGAKIMVPVDSATGDIKFDIYMRVLGKPNTCMNMNAYAYDSEQNLWFKAGTVYVSRKSGKSTFVRAIDLFRVWFCTIDPQTNKCADTGANLSVFNDIFDNYFWNILNDGTRLLQVRLYEIGGNP
jgi:hypothetical protein